MSTNIRTRVVLGGRDTPRFVSKEFYDAMHFVTAQYQVDFTLKPNTVEYKIPAHMVVERWEPFPSYSIQLNDCIGVPMCHKRRTLDAHTYVHREPKLNFDRFRVITEEYSNAYFLLTPNASYFDTAIYKDWEVRHVIYNDVIWDIHFKQVFVDPHNTRSTIWFYSHPKYQIEMIAYQDYRANDPELKQAIMSMLPSSFR
jgi:hypothetical protein